MGISLLYVRVRVCVFGSGLYARNFASPWARWGFGYMKQPLQMDTSLCTVHHLCIFKRKLNFLTKPGCLVGCMSLGHHNRCVSGSTPGARK